VEPRRHDIYPLIPFPAKTLLLLPR